LAVSKGVPAERIAEALHAGHGLFGESRVQEAEPKIAALARFRGARWHLVGHLQSNKARRAVPLFEAIHSVDSVELAGRLDRISEEAGRRLSVYLEVNVDGDPAKSGFGPEDLRGSLEVLLGLAALELVGLMTVGALAGDPEAARPTFGRLAALSAELRDRDSRLGAGLSMGMSDDFEVAVEEGATIVRVGRAIFGERSAGERQPRVR
jgi:PLP dependent protein